MPTAHCPQVRKLAAAADLANKDRKDSQGICFLGKVGQRTKHVHNKLRSYCRQPLQDAWDTVACMLRCTALDFNFFAFDLGKTLFVGCAGQVPRVCARAPRRVAGPHLGGGDGPAAGGARRLLVLHRGAAGGHQAAGRAVVSTAMRTVLSTRCACAVGGKALVLLSGTEARHQAAERALVSGNAACLLHTMYVLQRHGVRLEWRT